MIKCPHLSSNTPPSMLTEKSRKNAHNVLLTFENGGKMMSNQIILEHIMCKCAYYVHS